MLCKPKDDVKKLSPQDYDDSFSIKRDTAPEQGRQERALQNALDMRKFEIELYWKRAGYFWTFIAVALAGFMAVQKEHSPESEYMAVVIGSLGIVFSFAWYCVNKGSKHWQENWENHVDLLEDQIAGPLYKTTFRRPKIPWTLCGLYHGLLAFITGPGPFSVSKINQLVSLFVIVVWVVLLRHVVHIDFGQPPDWKYATPIALAIATCLVIFVCGRTDLGNYEGLRAFQRRTTIAKPGRQEGPVAPPPNNRAEIGEG